MELIILHNNDTHGYLTPLPAPDGETLGGYARRATFIAQQRAAHPHLLLLDAGDFYQGSRYWHAFRGEPDIALMNQLGYDAAALGNHDFDGGLDLLNQRLTEANFPLLCANFIPRADHLLANKWKPYVIHERAGCRIAIFSLLFDDIHLYPPEFATAIERRPILETAATLTHYLRKRANMVILLSHLGQDGDIEIAKQIDNIDLIVGGHSHTPLHEILWVDETPIVRGTVGTQFMGRVRAEIEPNKAPVIHDYRLIPLDSSVDDDPAIAANLGIWQAKLPAEQIVGYLSTPIDTRHEVKGVGESAAGNLYVDALLAFAQANVQTDVELAFAHMGTLTGRSHLRDWSIYKS
ncbi:metallophosphoesterase [Chloroflexi bacterium TSY]|nr:metallophosphoesterase [Chloroflexi bacterium TSY]